MFWLFSFVLYDCARDMVQAHCCRGASSIRDKGKGKAGPLRLVCCWLLIHRRRRSSITSTHGLRRKHILYVPGTWYVYRTHSIYAGAGDPASPSQSGSVLRWTRRAHGLRREHILYIQNTFYIYRRRRLRNTSTNWLRREQLLYIQNTFYTYKTHAIYTGKGD